MSRSDWLRYGTLVALIIAVIAATIWTLREYKQDQAQQRQEASAYDSERADQQGYDPCLLDTGFIDRLNCFLRELKTQRADKRAEADLKAQQDMAAWALALLIVSALGLIVTTAGVLLVLWSLKLARESIAKAAEANELSRQAMFANQRPWIPYPKIKLDSDLSYTKNGACFSILLEFRNSGRTPARGVHIERSVFQLGSRPYTTEQQSMIAEAKARMPLKDGATMFSDDKITWSFELCIGPEELSEIRTGSRQLLMPIVVFCAEYGSTFDETNHVTSFMVELGRKGTAKRFRRGLEIDVPYGRDALALTSPIGGGFAD
jgi:hypothetical protein